MKYAIAAIVVTLVVLFVLVGFTPDPNASSSSSTSQPAPSNGGSFNLN